MGYIGLRGRLAPMLLTTQPGDGVPSSLRIFPRTTRAALGKNQNTYEKHRREAEKKRKAEDKRRNKLLPKPPSVSPDLPPDPPPAAE
jgi:hypothetical protein